MKEGLKKLKQIGRFGIESIDKTKVTETPNQSTSALQPTVSNTNDTTAPEPLSIKVKNEQQGDYMSEEAFKYLSSPKKGKKGWGRREHPRPPQQQNA